MDPEREGYPDDVPRPDVVPVHVAIFLAHVAVMAAGLLFAAALAIAKALGLKLNL
jgi:hypothetical protein